MTSITERVAAGAAFLDEHDPEWWRADVERAIDLDSLRLSHPASCILGQRCPAEAVEQFVRQRFGWRIDDVEDPEDFNFWAFAHALSGIPFGREGDPNGPVVTWSSALGLNSATADADEYGELTTEWTRIITERRAPQ